MCVGDSLRRGLAVAPAAAASAAGLLGPVGATDPPCNTRPMPRSVRYAWNGEVSLAYEVTGDGDADLVLLTCAPNNLDIQHEHPRLAAYLDRLARRRRLIATDRRGTGLS